MEFSAAPMEGLTGFVWRQIHHKYFGGADVYYIPFVSPTKEPKFTPRQMRELSPGINKGLEIVPQLLTKDVAAFHWAALSLADLGYREVNLNLGCPAGTVTAKNKGSGALRNPSELDDFLHEIFSLDLPIPISIKTRIGWSDEAEFKNLAEIYSQYPIKRLIIHPRLKTDQYKGMPRKQVFSDFYEKFPFPLGWSGDVSTVKDASNLLQDFPNLEEIMIGRAIIGDPALFRKIKGGRPASKEELMNFYEELLETFTVAFESQKNALMRMKEYWFYQLGLFEDGQKWMKPLVKSKSIEDYRGILDRIFELPLRTNVYKTWFKPLNP